MSVAALRVWLEQHKKGDDLRRPRLPGRFRGLPYLICVESKASEAALTASWLVIVVISMNI